MELNKIYHGDCLQSIKILPDNSVDSIVTDPPYGLSFMGKKRDYDVPSQAIWEQCLRVLKPGGYLLAFAGTRTQHRMAVRIEDAGFEIRDMIAWVYGSGFPKSLNIGKAVDKLQGNERKEIGANPNFRKNGIENNFTKEGTFATTEGMKVLTKDTSEWEGRGTALKPAIEPITVARKPLSEKTVAENCLKWGTGGINIDESRVDVADSEKVKQEGHIRKGNVIGDDRSSISAGQFGDGAFVNGTDLTNGRFPANLIHDNSEEVRECFPDTGKGNGNGAYNYAGREYDNKDTSMFNGDKPQAPSNFNDSGNASRFFRSIIYQAKASKSERGNGNNHPTVKPIALMEYLIKMVTKEGGIVLDPFMGSGTTVIAAKKNGYNFIGMEMDEDYIKIAEARIESVKENNKLFDI